MKEMRELPGAVSLSTTLTGVVKMPRGGVAVIAAHEDPTASPARTSTRS